ncbi:D-alanine--D-alanine ligase B [Candidatus Erwinia haradaeae]|uniref:D-alanine--D-alanine ligase n=1 Tax=Candidatus Erwinia haradaeae TaxID=1922217 RepID=A0A451DCW5_9GAMM|nr:D-alanine--D-alanine ligase [Candidatus Erwinia haradaeae]VFP84313.1 D-alanine--D-alanine ligase B [Candidatus Erwinia haradaeae]
MVEKIAVLLGGNSAERNISLLSGQEVFQALRDIGMDAQPVDIRDFPILQLKKEGFMKAFIALHGRGGEDGTIQGVLEYLQIPYTGSGILASAISMDKLRSKYIWKGYGLPVAPFVALKWSKINGDLDKKLTEKIETLGLPVFVKPNREGSSIGISRVNKISDLKKALTKAFRYDQEVLVEAFLSGAEYTVGILGSQSLPPICIQYSEEFYNYNAKYISDGTHYLLPSGLSLEKEAELQSLSLSAWNALGCRGCGRIDIITGNDGKFYLLEVNTSPGMTQNSLIPRAAKKIGISFSTLVKDILNLSH